MRARVSSASVLPVVQAAGIRFTRQSWVLVPVENEAEIARNPYLEIEPDQPEEQEQPVTLVVNKRSKRVSNI